MFYEVLLNKNDVNMFLTKEANVTLCKQMRLFEGDIKIYIFNILFTKNDFHIILLSKVIIDLISNCLITSKNKLLRYVLMHKKLPIT